MHFSAEQALSFRFQGARPRPLGSTYCLKTSQGLRRRVLERFKMPGLGKGLAVPQMPQGPLLSRGLAGVRRTPLLCTEAASNSRLCRA